MSFSIPTIFAAGVLTFASPCVLPLMPVYLATIAGGSFESARPRRTLAVALAFVLGLTAVFVVLGALASTVGALLVAHRTPIAIASGLLMLVFGARAFGLLRLRTLDREARPLLVRLGSVSSLAGAFLFGAAFALGWSPCIGPVLAGVLSYAAANANSPLQGAAYLAVYAAGLSLPLLVLAAGVTRARAWVKRARSAIPVFEKLTGAAFLAIGAWTLHGALLDRPGASESNVVVSAPAAAGVEASTCAAEPGTTCALPAIRADAPSDVTAPAGGAQFIEFTARDCPVCRRMRPVVEKLVAACTELDARVVQIDVATPTGRALADRHRVLGTPTFVLVDAQGVEQARLLGENSTEALSAALERAFGVSCWG